MLREIDPAVPEKVLTNRKKIVSQSIHIHESTNIHAHIYRS